MAARIKRGDRVVVLAGKDRGARGVVRQIIKKHERVVVEGVNMIKRHQKARSANEQSQIVEKEAPIHLSNVMLIDPNTDEPTRVAFQRSADGSAVRVSKNTGEVIE